MKKKGMVLMEAVLYVTLFVIGIVILGNLGLSLMRASRETSLTNTLSSAGPMAMNRILLSIRDANYLDIVNSKFSATSGVLALITEDASEAATTTKFFASSSVLYIQQIVTAGDPSNPQGDHTGGHHDACNTNNDCNANFPVCCSVPSHGPEKLCETNAHHGAICGLGVAPTTTPIVAITPPNISVLKFGLTNNSATNSKSVSVEFLLGIKSGRGTTTVPYYSSAVLRGSY
ncbi:MAG TPA: hypothetical protein VJJ22_02480 [Candidatus Paceibacterota bacterium]